MSDLSEDPHKEAAAHGWEVVVPSGSELQIDADDAESLATMDAMIGVLRDNGVDVDEMKRTTSPGGNTHVYLAVGHEINEGKPLTDLERIALQACLGSDRKRELLSLLRVMLHIERIPTLFYEKPETPAVEAFADDLPF